MAQILNCPKCKVEYWGKIKNAKCGCGYIFNIIFYITDGWYDFTKLNQSSNYIKINSLRCLTNKQATKQARNILHNKKANIIIKGAA